MKNKALLTRIYDAGAFAENAQNLTELLAKNLKDNFSPSDAETMPWSAPDDMLHFWSEFVGNDVVDIFSAFIDKSIKLHRRGYMGHQVVPPAPDGVLASYLGAMINNGGAVYEMGMASNALEKIVIDQLLPYFGFGPGGGGIFTSGGSLANLTACLCARASRYPALWHSGHGKKCAFMVCAEAHYSIDRAIRIMGMGDQGLIFVPANKQFVLDQTSLERTYSDAIQAGIDVIGIIGNAPSTSSGMYDPLEAMGAFAKKHGLWFHIDAAHGGPCVFSPKYRHLMAGCSTADSITVDGHKMMMMPALSTLLLFKDEKESYRTFTQEAQYLWSSADNDWPQAGKRTFECTKLVMSLRFYVLMQQYGTEGFRAFLEMCYDNGRTFYDLLVQDPFFEPACKPDSNIVCFRPVGHHSLEVLTSLRMRLLEDGRFYIVQTTLRNQPWLRVSLMNPFTEESDMILLLTQIKTMINP